MPSFRTEAEILITHAITDRILDKKEAAFICKEFYSKPYFYHFPKLHKDAQNPPSRPIVASMNSISSGFSLYVDSFLQPLAQALQSYIRDSTHLMELLSPYTWTDSYFWLSLDVNSLYTSIPHDVGLLAVQNFLLTDPMLNTRQAAFILDTTSFCLTHNYFHFEGQFYLQTHGTAMGANFSTSYANLTMGHWENLFIWNNNPFAQHIVFLVIILMTSSSSGMVPHSQIDDCHPL